MNNSLETTHRQKLIQRYISALDNGNFDDVMIVLEEASKDSVLDQMIVEINRAIEQEEELTSFAKDAYLVRDLVQTHFDPIEILKDERQITIADVAARMQVDRKVPLADQEIHKQLLRLATPLPEILNIQAIRKLASNLQINASEKFWRVFRDTAIMLGIGHGQARMAAARKQKENKSAAQKRKSEKNK